MILNGIGFYHIYYVILLLKELKLGCLSYASAGEHLLRACDKTRITSSESETAVCKK